jgi:hypothetical protein
MRARNNGRSRRLYERDMALKRSVFQFKGASP